MRYFILTFGCQMNKSDSERIATILEKKGYKPIKTDSSAEALTKADLIVVNMCSVRQSAVDRVFGISQKFSKLKIENKKLKTILTGCILRNDKIKFAKKFDLILDVRDLPSWQKFFKTRSNGLIQSWQNYHGSCDYLEIQPKYQNNLTVFIPISTGCNNNCSYCVVPFTRGRLVCRDRKEILNEIKNAIKKGVKEIWLLGQNVNDYINERKTGNKKQKINFAKLIKMVDEIPGDFKFFFVSPHPKNFSDELIETLAKCEKFGKYFNLPVQSGDDEILKKMRRNYTVEEYKELVKKIRKKIPGIKLSTDIIVGFPGEKKAQFENTVKLFKKIKFNMAYIAKYSSRAGTAAAEKMDDDVSQKEKRRRWKILNDILIEDWKNKKLIVILGPTASGKSELAVNLAKKFNGEIISADSRQVYRDMDIGTGKVTEKEMEGIPHHLLDVASPKRKFTVTQYRKLALKAIDKVFSKGKAPILCGGTGFYIQAVVDGMVIPEVPPDWKLRKGLEKKPVEELYQILKELDLKRAKTIDKKNKRRLIRALEIVLKTKKTVSPLQKQPLPYPVVIIGIKKEKTELKKLIKKRLLKRLKQGMVEEVKKLRESGISWKRLEEFGLEYRFAAQYLQKKIDYDEMINLIQKESEQYAKRQMTWFKKDKRIHWVKNYKEAERLLKDFLKK